LAIAVLKDIRGRVIAVIVLAGAGVKLLPALEQGSLRLSLPPRPLEQTEGSSLPAIQAIAQTSEGYLWLGTKTGLLRFDGVRLRAVGVKLGRALAGQRYTLSALLFPGRPLGGYGFRRLPAGQGRIIRYPAADRLLNGLVFAMAEDSSGALWVITLRETNTSLADPAAQWSRPGLWFGGWFAGS